MTLLDRMIHAPGEQPIPGHEFFALLAEFSEGAINQTTMETKLQADPFNMTTQELTALRSFFMNEVNPLPQADRFTYMDRLHRIILLGQTDIYTRAEVKSRLNWTQEP